MLVKPTASPALFYLATFCCDPVADTVELAHATYVPNYLVPCLLEVWRQESLLPDFPASLKKKQNKTQLSFSKHFLKDFIYF